LNGGLASPCRKVVIGYMQLLIASELPPHSHCTLMTLPLLVRESLGIESLSKIDIGYSDRFSCLYGYCPVVKTLQKICVCHLLTDQTKNY